VKALPRTAALACALATAVLAWTSAATAATSDPYFGLQWSLQQLRAEPAWSTSTGAGQVIAVVDTGVDLTHPDLAGKLVPGATFTGCANKPAGCGNGDWKSGSSSGAPSPHGTHVAGIAAAATNNGIGIAGVAPDAKIMPVKVLTADGGSFDEVAAGVRWAADHGANVITLSLGALPGAQALVITGIEPAAEEAIAYALSKGIVVTIAAGNEFVAPLCDEPAFTNGALCVVATDRDELKASYSNFAIKPDSNVVAAPGGAALLACGDDVISTVPAGTESSCGAGRPGYDFYAGTSMATPHVAGVAALLTAQGRTAAQVVSVLKATARTPGVAVRGTYTPVYGSGIVDAAAAVAAP
jgi:serine protease